MVDCRWSRNWHKNSTKIFWRYLHDAKRKIRTSA